MEIFSEIKVHIQTTGSPADDMDLLVASTTLTIKYTSVTNNEKRFTQIRGLRIENWTKE